MRRPGRGRRRAPELAPPDAVELAPVAARRRRRPARSPPIIRWKPSPVGADPEEGERRIREFLRGLIP